MLLCLSNGIFKMFAILATNNFEVELRSWYTFVRGCVDQEHGVLSNIKDLPEYSYCLGKIHWNKTKSHVYIIFGSNQI